jgi:hypothetical protein
MPKNLHGSKRKATGAARVAMETTTQRHKEARNARQARCGHARTRAHKCKTIALQDVAPPDVKLFTFQDEYRTYRKTRGKRGLSPDPAKRKTENPRVKSINSIFNGGVFPLTELMSKPITKGR